MMQDQTDDATDDEPLTDHPLLSNYSVDDHEQAYRDSVLTEVPDR